MLIKNSGARFAIMNEFEQMPDIHLSGGAAMARRVLVVEDDEGLNHLAQKILRLAGFHTRGVLTGADAITSVQSDSGLVLLLDHQLPDMAGTEVIQKLISEDRQIPFVAVTGHGDEKIAVEMMKLGARDYLVKGLDLMELLPGVFERVFREMETDRKLAMAEKELRWHQERYKLLFNSINDAVFLQQLDDGRPGPFSEVNDIACEWLGYRREQLLRMTFRDIDGGGEEEDRHTALERLATSGRCVFDAAFVAKSGRKIPVELSCNAFQSKDCQYVLTVARDISERQQAQEALLESVDEIFKSAIRARDLVKQILSFSRQAENKKRPIRIQRILQEVIKLMRSTIPSNIDITHAIDSDCGPVLSDPIQVHQIAMNLITNAYHAVEADGGDITIGLAEKR